MYTLVPTLEDTMTLTSAPERFRPGMTSVRASRSASLPPSRVTRVLIADSLPMMGLGLRALLADGPDLTCCGMVHTARCAVERAQSTQPNLVVLDSSLDMGATGVRALRAAAPTTSVVVLVAERDAHTYLPIAARAGVQGVVRRSAHPSEVVAAIRAVRSGRVVIDPVLARCAPPPSSDHVLSDRQITVLALVARGYTTTAIAKDMGLAVETVRTHIKALLQRLNVHDRAHAVARGYELGVLTRTETPRSIPR